MKIVIVGDGKIGNGLAGLLCKEGHDVTIIDKHEELLSQTAEALDIMCVEGNGLKVSTQLEAGVDTADLLIATTAADEVNLVCCLMAKKLGAAHTIARVRNPEYDGELSLIASDLGLSLSVNPEQTCANEIARMLRIPSAIKTDVFAGGKLELLKFRLPENSSLCGVALMDLPKIVNSQILICAVERGDEDVFIPSGSFRLEAGDRISVLATMKMAQEFFRRTKLSASRIRNVMIVGGGRIGYYLAKQLLDAAMDVTLIETDLDRCEQLSMLLPKATILHGDGTDENFLRENGIDTADALVALTGIDEENILTGMFVRRTWPNIKVATKVNRESFQTIVDSMDVGSVFNPRISTSNLICRYVRAMQNTLGSQVETLYKIANGKAEALEFVVTEDEKLCGIPLQKLPMRKNLLIGGIIRKGKVVIPTGQTSIEVGDRVIVVTTVSGLKDLSDILSKS